MFFNVMTNLIRCRRPQSMFKERLYAPLIRFFNIRGIKFFQKYRQLRTEFLQFFGFNRLSEIRLLDGL